LPDKATIRSRCFEWLMGNANNVNYFLLGLL
jgi:hypothetical protein